MNLLAYLCSLLKGIIYGSTVYFVGALTESVDTLDVLALRFLLSFAVMWLLKATGILKIKISLYEVLSKGERRPFIKYLLLAALFEPVLYMFFETIGISTSGDITTAVIISLSPIFSCIAEMVFLKERATPLQMVFLGCGIIGAVYIAICSGGNEGGDSAAGIIFLFLAVISGVLFGVFSRRSSKHFKPLEITYTSSAMGALIFNAVNLVRHLARGDIANYFKPYFSLENMIGFLFLGVASTIVATLMNNYAVSRLRLSTNAAFGGVSTLVTIVIGVLCGERLRYYHFIGLPLILIRMIGVSTISIIKDRRREKQRTAEEVGNGKEKTA